MVSWHPWWTYSIRVVTLKIIHFIIFNCGGCMERGKLCPNFLRPQLLRFCSWFFTCCFIYLVSIAMILSLSSIFLFLWPSFGSIFKIYNLDFWLLSWLIYLHHLGSMYLIHNFLGNASKALYLFLQALLYCFNSVVELVGTHHSLSSSLVLRVSILVHSWAKVFRASHFVWPMLTTICINSTVYIGSNLIWFFYIYVCFQLFTHHLTWLSRLSIF